jgi:hypothetical protein
MASTFAICYLLFAIRRRASGEPPEVLCCIVEDGFAMSKTCDLELQFRQLV